jgi:glucuronate isomerase
MLRLDRRDPDRLLPAERRVRTIARDLYERVATRPIISPHGHVPARMLAENSSFDNPAKLFVTDDHYITRMLHSAGVPLEALGVGDGAEADPRVVWLELARHWHRFAGTASGYWLEEALDTVLGIGDQLTTESADTIYDRIVEQLSRPEYRPRTLLNRFGIEFLATTDDPLDDLENHQYLAENHPSTRIVPTFRPDRYLDANLATFPEDVHRLLGVTAQPATFAGYLGALEERRAYFVAHGAVSTDHGVEEPHTVDLDGPEAERIFASLLNGTSTASERRAFSGHMLLQMARMSVDDGLVMTVHAGVLRNHSTATKERFGPDTGHDIPVPTSFTRGLRPLLEKYGLVPDFHLVLFAVDETTYSRELAPLAGFYPSVYVGAPWWFLDAPDAMARFRSAVTETAGFYRTSGFIDDTRAFLSIPARHDTARRADAGFLARLVSEGRLTLPAAERIADDLVSTIPREVFKL